MYNLTQQIESFKTGDVFYCSCDNTLSTHFVWIYSANQCDGSGASGPLLPFHCYRFYHCLERTKDSLTLIDHTNKIQIFSLYDFMLQMQRTDILIKKI